jgi:AraC-like DNA-binding protein
MGDYTKIDFKKYLELLQPDHIFNDDVAIIEINGNRETFVRPELYPLKINVISILIAVRGKATVNIDYFSFSLIANNIINILWINIFNGISFSIDFKGYYVVISSDLGYQFIKTIPPPRELLERKRLHPILTITDLQAKVLMDIVNKLISNIGRRDHIYQSTIVSNEVVNLYLEILDMDIKKMDILPIHYEVNHNESVIRDFMQLILENSRTEHNVLFYAARLYLTTTQLSRILKAQTGKTAINWINEVQILESRLLLRKKELLIQEVAEIMNFSDQSSFGKFFKKHTGMSPLEYRNSIYQR